ncbi:MAG: hypothetical protein IPK80_08515 [Nannocystis sp.]|nr:hypothetical protein [Nannocystis sp.]
MSPESAPAPLDSAVDPELTVAVDASSVALDSPDPLAKPAEIPPPLGSPSPTEQAAAAPSRSDA